MRVIGLDIGFGHTKVVYDGGKVKFPSWIAYWTGSGVEDIRPVEYEGRYFVVGEKAKFSTKRVEIAGVEELIKYYPLFVKHILNVLEIPSKQAMVITGLPPRYSMRMEEVRKGLSGIGVRSLLTFQGFGIYYDVREEVESGLVLDIGFNTVDYFAFSVEDGKLVKELAGTIAQMGVLNAVSLFRDMLPPRFEGLKNKAISSLVSVFVEGSFKGQDLSEVKRRALEQWNEMLRARLNQEISAIFLEKEQVVVAGGGAYLVDKNIFEQEVIIPDEPEFSNARGYYKFGAGA